MKTTEDWHPAEIIAALRKQGTSLSALSRESGLKSATLSNALHSSWPKGEWIIANRLGFHPSHIWPSRYFDKMGHPIKRRPRNRDYMGDAEYDG